MRYRAEVSKDAEEQLSRFPKKCGIGLERAINELEEKDDSEWTNSNALQGRHWTGRLRKRVGDCRIILRKFPESGLVEISAILIKSKDTYR